jgi:hypothetical protein
MVGEDIFTRLVHVGSHFCGERAFIEHFMWKSAKTQGKK